MSSHRLREIPKHNCLKSWHNEVMNLAPDQPCKVRKTTKDRDRDHEQEEEVTLVSAGGILALNTLLGDYNEFLTKKAATPKEWATIIEADNRELTTWLVSLE